MARNQQSQKFCATPLSIERPENGNLKKMENYMIPQIKVRLNIHIS